VLFIFTIMLLNAGEEERTGKSQVAMMIGVPGVAIGAVLVAWVLLRHGGTDSVPMFAMPGVPHDIAQLLFHDFLLPFEVTSVLVLIAIMGAVVLASKPESIAPTFVEPAQKEEVLELVGAGKERR
jgi:NADH-quinone oxidoreductase subunit J